MTITERANVLERLLDVVRDQERLQEKVGRANDQAGYLAEAGRALATIATAVQELTRAERPLPRGASERGRDILTGLTRALADVRENALAPVEADFAGLVDKSKDYAREITAWAEQAWTEVRRSVDMPAVDEELLDQLDRAGLDVEDLRSPVESAEGDLMLLESRHLPAEGDIGRLMAAAAKRREAVDRLQQLLSPDVAQFIVAASKPPGAALSLLTDEVRAFLNDHDIEPRYRLRLV